jgi:GT2 family glycosyltransferase
MNRHPLRYLLITPAKNEELHIEKTIKSVVSQTNLPLEWIIVSDGSTDRTDAIVREYAQQYSWMRLLRMPEHEDRHFAAKAKCFNAGYAATSGMNYEIIGNLDADLSFEPEYFAYLLDKFRQDPRLGAAGTPFVEGSSVAYDYSYTNIEHVSGACQLFRRECFEQIGGYPEIRGGGIDWVAVTKARMLGWTTRTFTEMSSVHHRPIGRGTSGRYKGLLMQGKKDYLFGNHPLWETLRVVYQMKRATPTILAGGLIAAGYLLAAFQQVDRPIPRELIKFARDEQLGRLRRRLLKSRT